MNTEKRLKFLENAYQEMLEWKQEKERQQISYPIDEASRNTIFELNPQTRVTGTGSAGTEDINLTGNAQTITVPAQPSGTVLIQIDGATYELLKK